MNETQTPSLEISGSRLFSPWLAGLKASLAFTTYQAGKLFLIGLKPDGRLSVFERTFDRCMGLGVRQGQLWMSSLYQLWRFENFLDPGALHDGYDALYVPVAGHTTGDIDIAGFTFQVRHRGWRRMPRSVSCSRDICAGLS